MDFFNSKWNDWFDLDKAARDITGFHEPLKYDYERAALDICLNINRRLEEEK